MKTQNKNKASIWHSLGLAASIILGVIIYAYGFQVTKVNLEETKSPRRQEQLLRIIRALSKPDLLEYNKEEIKIDLPVTIPCEGTTATTGPTDKSKPYLVMVPACAQPGDEVTLDGFNFPAKTGGPVNFIPPSNVKLELSNIETDEAGHFQTTIKLPNRPNTVEQKIETIVRQPVGMPHLTQTAYDTWDKIIETIFLALLATTIGTLLSIPISFFAARNLMKEIVSNLIGLSAQIIAIPIGFFIGQYVADWMSSLGDLIADYVWLALPLVIIVPWIGIRIIKWALPEEELVKPAAKIRAFRILAITGLLLISLISISVLAGLMDHTGLFLAGSLGAFSFLGSFLKNIGQILRMLITITSALIAAGVLSSYAGRMGVKLHKQMTPIQARLAGILLAMIAGVVIFVLLGAGVNFIYQIENPLYWAVYPGIAGALGGLIVGVRSSKKDLLPIGMVIYYVTRTILNALRSIESLIMVIVFVVWVGIGPFAGVLALSLHTIAALAKLYSEQVESIMSGPVEAIKATGANWMQTVVYAVIPQIIPPYISFTMYRWDINVRMSTIIGFAGGGGIGFLLIQNINLLNYRAASAQMIAIAIVVASMDYLSSKLREKVV
jgi:phosphonate ABC transporter permease subunit PhnE